MEDLLRYAHSLLQEENHVLISKIYEDKRITCAMMGIDGPDMLYSLLRLNSGMPLICRAIR